MKLINLIEEDFTNYKKPGMFLGFPFCSGKCNPKDALPICQNQQLHSAKLIDISAEEIITRYYNNPIPRCLIFGGLEPFDTFTAMIEVIDALHNCSSFLPYTVKKTNPDGYATVDDADIVIYTGYYPWEIETQLYKMINHIFCETHERFVVNGVQRLENIKDKIALLNIENIHLDWV